jgi:hypothetical protein
MTASQGRGGVEHCLSSNFRVLGLQVIKTSKDLPVGTHGTSNLVTTGPAINNRFPFMPVGNAFPRHLFVTTGLDCGGVEVGFPREVRVRCLQIIETRKDFVVGANGASGLVDTGSTVRSRFPFVPVIRAFPPHLLAAAECNGRRVKHCFGSKFRVGLR